MKKAARFAEINRRMAEKLAATQADDPKQAARSKRYWDRMLKIAAGRKRKLNFYGKVVDQFGDPVPNAEMVFNARSGYLVGAQDGKP